MYTSRFIPALFILLSSPAFADDLDLPSVPDTASISVNTQPDSPKPGPQSDAPASNSLFQQALAAPPPQRASFGPLLAQSQQSLDEIDQWIQNTPVDNPQNLIVKDILLAMPTPISGPRLVSLAQKSHDPQIQESWARWLQKYPKAYAAVLVSWLRQDNKNPERFRQLLTDYESIKPDDALHIWTQLITQYPVSELQSLAAFGNSKPGCARQTAASLIASADEISRLRAARGLIHCEDAAALLHDESILSDLTQQIELMAQSTAPSRRIVALDLIRSIGLNSLQNIPLSIFNEAKNTTVRAHALRALESLHDDGQNDRIIKSLIGGDEALRLESASLLARRQNLDGFDPQIIQEAFAKEIWPDTQLQLYAALVKSSPNPLELPRFQKNIILDDTRTPNLRMTALNDLMSADPKQITFEDMAALQNQKTPNLDLIAAIAESMYEHQPDTRPALRSWLKLQQPFERRFLATFARFIQIDERNHDDASIDTFRAICNAETPQEAIIRPCIHYLQNHAQTDADHALVEKLQKRQVQMDAMTNFEF